MKKNNDEKYLEAVNRNLDAVVNDGHLLYKYTKLTSVEEVRHKIGIRKNDHRFDNDARMIVILH